MADLDVYPVTVRGPIGPLDHHASFARVFTHDGKFWLARGRNRGAEIMTVQSYDPPEGEPRVNGRSGAWGEWSWNSCGCSSQWGSHDRAAIAAFTG